jgi:hypothetical protein
MSQIHKAYDRVFLGFRAKTVDDTGMCFEYTDPMPQREEARKLLEENKTEHSEGVTDIVIVKVYTSVPTKDSLRQALSDLLDTYKTWEEVKNETGLPDERCKEIWVLSGRYL